MSVTTAPEVLPALRLAIADLAPPDEGRLMKFGVASLDQALAGGLLCGALHEIGPAAPLQGGAAVGFAVAIAVLALRLSSPSPSSRQRGVVWIQPDFTALEAGFLYGPGLALMGIPMERLVILCAPRPRDALWAMEESLKCRAVAAVVAELGEADLTATRRLTLAAGEGGGLGLILHQSVGASPSTAMTRWEIASAGSECDPFGGLGPTSFALSLVKNRRGRTGAWRLSWDHHEHAFFPAPLPVPVAAAARDGSPSRLSA
jgi:protein ImuA